MFTTVPSGRTFYYTCERGDTLQRVAARYGVTASELKQWNGLVHETRCAAGQRLRVTSDVVPVAKAGGRSKRRGRDQRGGASEADGDAKTAAPAKPRQSQTVRKRESQTRASNEPRSAGQRAQRSRRASGRPPSHYRPQAASPIAQRLRLPRFADAEVKRATAKESPVLVRSSICDGRSSRRL